MGSFVRRLKDDLQMMAFGMGLFVTPYVFAIKSNINLITLFAISTGFILSLVPVLIFH